LPSPRVARASCSRVQTPLPPTGSVHSPGGCNLSCGSCDRIGSHLTSLLLVILGGTDRRAAISLAGVPIGLSLTLIHLISIPATNASGTHLAAPVLPCGRGSHAISVKSGSDLLRSLERFWPAWCIAPCSEKRGPVTPPRPNES